MNNTEIQEVVLKAQKELRDYYLQELRDLLSGTKLGNPVNKGLWYKFLKTVDVYEDFSYANFDILEEVINAVRINIKDMEAPRAFAYITSVYRGKLG